MKIKINAVLDAEISDEELAKALFVVALRIGGLEGIDDAGSDWFTDHHGNTYIAHRDWKVSSNPQVAAMIDAHYALKGWAFDSFKLPDAEQAA